jgi:hypothetical protein
MKALLIMLLVLLSGCGSPKDPDKCWGVECESRKGEEVTILVNDIPTYECIQVFHDRSMTLIGCEKVKP